MKLILISAVLLFANLPPAFSKEEETTVPQSEWNTVIPKEVGHLAASASNPKNQTLIGEFKVSATSPTKCILRPLASRENIRIILDHAGSLALNQGQSFSMDAASPFHVETVIRQKSGEGYNVYLAK